MPKEKFDILESTCVPLPLENVDTDQIIPARFLSATTREGFGENLFRDWRFDKSGKENKSSFLTIPNTVARFWLPVRILVADQAGNMLYGRLPIMDSGQ